MCVCVYACKCACVYERERAGREVQMADVTVEKFMMPCLEIPGGYVVVPLALERTTTQTAGALCVKRYRIKGKLYRDMEEYQCMKRDSDLCSVFF